MVAYNSFLRTFYDTAIEKWNDEVMRDCHTTSANVTYCRLCAKIMDYQNRWNRFGLLPGDKIAICSNSSVAWATLFMAIQASGFVAVCLSDDLFVSLPHVEHAGCSIIYVNQESVHNIDFQKISDLQLVISIKDNTVLWSRHSVSVNAKRVKNILPGEFHIVERTFSDVALIIYTSGSSSNIKGVMLTIGNISANMHSIAKSFPYKRSCKYLSVLPFFHIFGLIYDVLMPICYGLQLFVLNAPPVPSILFRALKKTNPDMFFSVPIVYYKILEVVAQIHKDDFGRQNVEEKRSVVMSYFGKNCKYLVTGGASVNKEWLQSVYKEYNLPFFIGYGMSECASSICLPQFDTYKRFSCGKPIEIVEFKIASTNPLEVPGEIMMRGDIIFKGYYKDEKLTKSVVDDDGWFHTKDLATMSEEGDVFIVGRMDTMCVTASGENVYSEDIEAEIAKIEGVIDVVVALKGNYLIAYVVRDKVFSEKQIQDSIYNIDTQFTKGVYIQEIKWVDFVARTPKGTIKRQLYL